MHRARLLLRAAGCGCGKEADEEFDDELEQLTRTELVFRHGTPPDATYTFKHALVQDAAYDSLPDPEATRDCTRGSPTYWRRSFRSLAANEPELLAYHRTEAGHLIAAIPLWRRAGESALARVALQEAVSLPREGTGHRRSTRAFRRARQPRALASGAVALGAATVAWLGSARSRRERHGDPSAGSETAPARRACWSGSGGCGSTRSRRAGSQRHPPGLDRLLVEGRQSGDIDLQIFGHRALLSSHFYLGELQEALEQRDRILALYDPPACHAMDGADGKRHQNGRWRLRVSVALDAGLSGPGGTESATKRTPMLASWGIPLTSVGR